MIVRCVNRSICSRVLQRCRGRAGACVPAARAHQKDLSRTATTIDSPKQDKTLGTRRQYDIFKRLPHLFESKHEPDVWSSLLEATLPPHLRKNAQLETDVALNAQDIAEILLAAQRFVVHTKANDLLYHLGIVEGRWSAVVWIVKRLVEALGGQHVHSERTSPRIFLWRNDTPLRELTQGPIDYQQLLGPLGEPRVSSNDSRSLDDLTDDVDKDLWRHKMLRRDALGQVWRSLGTMTIACADTEIKPEILEIIAYLHHMEIMPLSIYNQKPSPDVTAIQQPPTLSLFSSRILTSLSDAAWRAHEKIIVEEAKATSGEYASLRPEIPGMAYRVNVGGLRPEVWLELILWSCLHGGWTVEAGEILRMIYSEPPNRQWRPFSWRTLVPYDENGDEDWDKLEYSFKTRAPPNMDQEDVNSTSTVQRTISSEVVNAYIDASLSTMRLGVGERGVHPGYVVNQWIVLRKFLDRSGLSLHSGSWDAIILRFYDLQGNVVNLGKQFLGLTSLSPMMGEGLDCTSGQDLPAYVLDGSAAVLGLSHQALRSRIKAGDVEGAFKLFRSLQARADRNKRQSIVDFLQQQRHFAPGSESLGTSLFTTNFSGIDYPAFYVQVPPTILGPFLELVTDAKAYDFARWLLYADEIDGPVIPQRIYSDPALAPVLVRFAAETSDKALLSKMVRIYSDNAMPGQPTLPRNVLQSFFDSQVNLKRWDAAVRILQHMQDISSHWNVINLAQVARSMLFHFRKNDAEGPNHDFGRARALFFDMIGGKYDRNRERQDDTRDQVTMLIATIALLDRHWALRCLEIQPLKGHYDFALPTKAFNLVLEGIVKAYGSVVGRRVLGIFWPHSVRHAQRAGRKLFGEGAGELRMSTFRPSFLQQPDRQRTVIRFPLRPEWKIVMYGGLQPDLMTIRAIFRRALEEFKDKELRTKSSVDQSADILSPLTLQQESSADSEEVDEESVEHTASGMIVWSIRCLRMLRMGDEDIEAELRTGLEEHELLDIQRKVPDLFQPAGAIEDSSISTSRGNTSGPQDGGISIYSPFEFYGSS